MLRGAFCCAHSRKNYLVTQRTKIRAPRAINLSIAITEQSGLCAGAHSPDSTQLAADMLSSFQENREENRPRFAASIAMAERPVLVGLIPQVVVLDPNDQISWLSDAGNLRVEFDVNRCPFSSNVFQAPAGVRLLSGPPRHGLKAATYKYRLWLNDQLVGQGEVILREK